MVTLLVIAAMTLSAAIGYSLSVARNYFEIRHLNSERLKEAKEDEQYYKYFKQGLTG